MKPYVYSTLSDNRNFRLTTLHSGANDEQVRCKTELYGLPDIFEREKLKADPKVAKSLAPPPHEGLSWTRGNDSSSNSSPTLPIQSCDGEFTKTSIQLNLRGALR